MTPQNIRRTILGMEKYTQYRAIYQTPASILDTPEEREQGYVNRLTGPCKTIGIARLLAMSRSEETHAYVTGYESREVTTSDWEAA